jgi:hypothetical protein
MAQDSCPTYLVKTHVTADNESGTLLVNRSDFNPETMELVDPSEMPAKVVAETKEDELTAEAHALLNAGAGTELAGTNEQLAPAAPTAPIAPSWAQ